MLYSLISAALISLFTVSSAFAYSTGPKWQFDNVLYKNSATSFDTPIYNAAATWNSAAKFKIYNSSSATHYWNASNYGGVGGIVGITSSKQLNGILWYCNSDFNTYQSFSTSGTPSSSQFDAQSVALHEFGHWLQLNDLTSSSNSSSIMYYMIGKGTVKRALTTDDINGDKALYP